MNQIRQIAQKEVLGVFSSLAAFIFLGAFLVAVLFIFFWADPFFARNCADVRPLFEWMPTLMLFLVSALTMRMWSEERRAGTLEFLLTSPVSNLGLVLGKFFACLTLVALAMVLTLPLPISVAFIGQLDWGPVIGGYIASMFLAAAYISIGLFVSSRTDNQIVSLIVSVLVCAGLVLIGSDTLANFFPSQIADMLHLVGSATRFESITRGVIDFRDLYYYLSITGIFLSLNVFVLEEIRWAGNKLNSKHKTWFLATTLFLANFIAGNFWLQQINGARLDLTAHHLYSVSPVTKKYLASLKEPLLIRAYFSKKTHPLLAPLVPRLKDLLTEYALLGKGKVRLEIVDPQSDPELEKEAGEKYNIHPSTFRTASKYEAAVTASYFSILVKYGDQFQTLSFRDLIAVKSQSENNLDVDLRNPEYDITGCIKKVMAAYQSGGNPFKGIDQPVVFVGYASADDKLPKELIEAKKAYAAVLEGLKAKSSGKFTYQFIDPDADGGATARELLTKYGFRPYANGDAKGAESTEPFWFNLTLRNADKLIALPPPTSAKADALQSGLETALKRFSKTFLKTIGVSRRQANPYLNLPKGEYRKNFSAVAKKLASTHLIKQVDLEAGTIPDEIDLMLILAPLDLSDKALFAVDQFLMKGGTVVMCTAPYDASLERPLTCKKVKSGLEDWLKHNGIEFQDAMVLDSQDFPFSMPTEREANGYLVEGTDVVAYPFFVDIRKDGMNPDGAVTGALGQVTLSWASPIKVEQANKQHLHVTELLHSSDKSWTSTNIDVVPRPDKDKPLGFHENTDKKRRLLGVAVEGSFESFYKGKKTNGIIEKSPDSARIILFASNTFLCDQMLINARTCLGTPYEPPVDLVENAVDWSLEDRELLSIRQPGSFASTLKTLTPTGAMLFEYANYLLAAAGLATVWLIIRIAKKNDQRKYKTLLEAAMKDSATTAAEVKS